jgi:uncharacterized phage-associated protein
MSTVLDVVGYIRSRFDLSGELQLQKLLYYAQSWHLVWEGKPLFPEPVQAWTAGPVVPQAWQAKEPAHFEITASERASIDAVLDYYGKQYGAALSQLTHTEAPWIEARRGLPAVARSSKEIPRSRMRSYYTERSLAGEGPKRHVKVAVADTDEVLAIARKQRARWSQALELLAER